MNNYKATIEAEWGTISLRFKAASLTWAYPTAHNIANDKKLGKVIKVEEV